MTQPEASPARRGTRTALVFGVLLLTGGVWLLLQSSGVDVSFSKLWPIFVLLAGAASIVDYLLTKRPDSVGFAVFCIGFGVLGFALTLDFTSLGKMLDWLPSFPTIVGLSFLASWLVGAKPNNGLAVAGWTFVALGVLGFAARFEVLQRLIPSAQMVWAVLFLVGGGALLWRVFGSRSTP